MTVAGSRVVSTPSTDPLERPPRILVVDDQERNRELFVEMLEPMGYHPVLAANGPAAIEIARAGDIDLVLLDVNMPGMSGLDVCRALRAGPSTTAIPILVVTALSNREQRLEGIAAGANDYLVKPVDRSDLLLRVRNALQLSSCHRRLATQYEELRQLEQLRDGMVHMLVHDLKGPLTGVVFVLEAMRRDVDSLDHPTLGGDLDVVRIQIGQMTAMVSDMLDVSRAESVGVTVSPERIDLSATVAEAVALSGHARRVPPIEVEGPGVPVAAFADRDAIRRVIANLVGNAVKFSPETGRVRIDFFRTDDGIRIEVADEGPGIPAAEQEMVFDKFTRRAGRERAGVGLGLTFCRMAVEANGGRIGVRSEPGRGAAFWFTLPPG